MNKLDISLSKNTFKSLQTLDYLPLLEKTSPVTEDEMRQYQKEIRQYFISGKKTAESLSIKVDPVLLAPYLRGISLELEYPVLCDHESHEITSLHQILQEMFSQFLDSEEMEELVKILPHNAAIIQEHFAAKNPVLNYYEYVEAVIKNLNQFSVHFREPELFEKACMQVKTEILSKEKSLIGFSALSVFPILNLQLKRQNESKLNFLNKLNKSIFGLKEILLLNTDESDSSKSHFDFADELLSMEKIGDFAPSTISSSLPKPRLDRLEKCLGILTKAQRVYSEHASTVFVTNNLAKEFSLEETLKEASLEITSGGSCTKAKDYYTQEIQDFVQVIASLRLADLEINQQYDENLHASYFEGFDFSYLSDDDLRHFPSLIVVEESRQLMKEPKDFLALLSDGALVKVLSINRLDEIGVTANHDDEEETFLELAALAIFRRNANVFQGGMDTPSWLNKTFQKGLDTPYPTLWNILFTSTREEGGNRCLLALKTAIESRYFPRLVFDVGSGEDFGSHFNISENPQPEQPFASFNQVTQSPTGEQDLLYSLSMADFLAMKSDNMDMLEILNSKYRNENLVPLAEYLNTSHESLVGKVPFIWMVDEQNVLNQAAIPISWVNRCRARLDYWRFIQELGGVNSYHVRHSIDQAKSEWKAQKESEVQDLKEQLKAEFDRIRSTDLEISVKRILNGLLDSDNGLTSLLEQSSNSPVTIKEVDEEVTETISLQDEEDHKSPISPDAWVESDECTSCNDCTDALPGVFKYNSDKQAVVHNPKGGTYAKIVATAEKCPAACIHPGLPHNPDEAGLEKLIKRAEKFN